jgi:hypothetical protein
MTCNSVTQIVAGSLQIKTLSLDLSFFPLFSVNVTKTVNGTERIQLQLRFGQMQKLMMNETN